MEVAAGGPVRIRVVAGNNGVARWLAREGDGQVRAVARDSDGTTLATAPLAADVERLGVSEAVEIALPVIADGAALEITMDAKGRTAFGERRRLVVKRR